jgi:hypothetical protein
MFGIDAILAIGGLIIPPAFEFIKKKFVGPEADTMEATANSIATTNPEVLPAFIQAQVQLLKAKVGWFNRDVIGNPSQWVVDIRACIRPVSVIIGFILLAADMSSALTLDPGTRGSIIVNNSSWFGSRIK